jgi:hypothetical protein
LPNSTGQFGNSTGPSGSLVDRPTTQVGLIEAPESTFDWPSKEGRYKDIRPTKPQEPKRLHVAEFVWPAKTKSSAGSHPHLTQKEKVKFAFNVAKCDKIFDELFKHGNIKYLMN